MTRRQVEQVTVRWRINCGSDRTISVEVVFDGLTSVLPVELATELQHALERNLAGIEGFAAAESASAATRR